MPFIDLTRNAAAVAPVAATARPTSPVTLASAIPRWFFPAIAAMAFGLSLLGGFLAWEHFHAPSAVGPSSALAAAYKAYHDSEGSALKSLADQVRSGSLARGGAPSDREAIGKALKQHSDSLSAALNGYFDNHCDAKGNLANPGAVADDFAAAARALGAK